MLTFFMAHAETFSYRFSTTSLPKAVLKIMDDHPDLTVNFIYNELEAYNTSASVKADDPYDALRQVIGQNPVMVMESKGSYYIEALQHGKYRYTGVALGDDNEPVVSATVMLLSPRDSTVMTYGITDSTGQFTIPCDHRKAIAKLSCLGYKTVYRLCTPQNIDTIIMPEDAVRLKGVKVESENVHLYTDRSSFIPTQRQKNSAQNALMLLSMMSIPQLDVDLSNNTVGNAQGQEISIFINYVAATSEDLSGMNTRDVKKVEYLLNPTDPRFHGERFVLNFVMHNYEWGGYTKLMASGSFIKNRAKASAYSKISYKRMTFDIYADENYKSKCHGGLASEELFIFTNILGEESRTVRREKTPLHAQYESNRNNLSLRAVYTGGNLQISNRMAITHTGTPHDDMTSELSYSPDIFPKSVAYNSGHRNEWAAHYNADLYAMLTDNLAFSTRGWYVFGKNRDYSDYTTDEGISIKNIAEETSHHFQLYPTFDWNLTKNHTLTLVTGTVHSWNDIDYLGNSPSRQTFNIGGYGVDAGYQLTLPRYTIGADVAWFWQTNRISGFKASDSSPQINFFISYAPNGKHQVRGTFFFGKEIPSASQKSPNLLRQDELIYYCGNPDLKDYTRINANASYVYIPSNSWQMSLDGFINIINDQCVPVYLPDATDGTMLRKYFNTGNMRNGCIRAGVTGRFLDGSLSVKIQPQLWIRRSKGEYAWHNNELACKIELQYFLGDIYFLAWYTTPRKFQTDNGAVVNDPSQYQFQAGWSHGAWNISAHAFNFFHSSWVERQESLSSKYFTYSRMVFGDGNHASYNLSVTYTFGYGKKVKHDGEIGGAGSTPSAILK